MAKALAPGEPITSIKIEHAAKPQKRLSHKVLAIRIEDREVTFYVHSGGAWTPFIKGKIATERTHSLVA